MTHAANPNIAAERTVAIEQREVRYSRLTCPACWTSGILGLGLKQSIICHYLQERQHIPWTTNQVRRLEYTGLECTVEHMHAINQSQVNSCRLLLHSRSIRSRTTAPLGIGLLCKLSQSSRTYKPHKSLWWTFGSLGGFLQW